MKNIQNFCRRSSRIFLVNIMKAIWLSWSNHKEKTRSMNMWNITQQDHQLFFLVHERQSQCLYCSNSHSLLIMTHFLVNSAHFFSTTLLLETVDALRLEPLFTSTFYHICNLGLSTTFSIWPWTKSRVVNHRMCLECLETTSSKSSSLCTYQFLQRSNYSLNLALESFLIISKMTNAQYWTVWSPSFSSS